MRTLFALKPRRKRFDLSIDLGTSNILVANNAGIQINEASYVAVRSDARGERELVHVGQPAKALEGKAPYRVDVARPLSQGVIGDFDLAASLMSHLMKRVYGGQLPWVRPRVLLSLPSDVTEVERRAFHEAALRAGARDVSLIPEPTAAALGLGVDIFAPRAGMVIDVGAGTSEVALFSLGGLVDSHSLRVGGDDMDQAIVQFLRSRYNFLVGLPTAEQLKIESSKVLPERSDPLRIHGMNLYNGLPGTLTIPPVEILEAFSPLVEQIVQAVLKGLERAPEELAADLTETGLHLTGGSALSGNLRQRLREETGLKVELDKHPLLAVARGEWALIKNPELLERVSEFQLSDF
jgi:rod shape-determining protein MreB